MYESDRLLACDVMAVVIVINWDNYPHKQAQSLRRSISPQLG